MTDSRRPGQADFPAWLHDKLDLHGWTQADFCRASGLSASVVYRYLTGKITPNIENSRLIARALGVSVLEVLVEAGQLTREEASAAPATALSADDLPDAEIVRQVARRFQRTAQHSEQDPQG